MSIINIQVDHKILKSLLRYAWTPLEEALVAIPVNFRFTGKKSYSRDGFLLITRGSIYMLKSTLLHNIELDTELHFLNIRKICFDDLQEMKICFDDYNLFLTTEHSTSVYVAILTILRNAIQGVPGFKEFKVESTFPLPKVPDYPIATHSLQWRILFFAHYYKLQGDLLKLIPYFNAWENDPTTGVVLGPGFVPGNFAPAVGHAIGWEPRLDTCLFQNFSEVGFADLFCSLVENANTVQKISFCEYLNSSLLPVFPNKRIAETAIKEWWFLRGEFGIIREFCKFAKNLLQPVENFFIATSRIETKDFIEFNHMVQETPSLLEMRSFQYIRNTSEKIPCNPIKNFLEIVQNLQVISFVGLEGNATEILATVCAAKTNIKILNITKMQFRSPINASRTLPKSIISLNLSMNAMAASTFRSIMQLIFRAPRDIPLSLQMTEMVFKEYCYSGLKNIMPNECNPVLGELDWSGNRIPKPDVSKFFFILLSTQSKLKYLKLERIKTLNPGQLLTDILTLMNMLHLPGLDLSGRFEKEIYTQFISGLSRMPWIRRLGLINSKLGDSGIQVFTDLVKALPNLDELCIDGIRLSSVEGIINLWSMLSRGNITSIDLPTREFKLQNITEENLDVIQESLYQIVLEKPRPTTNEQRTKYMIAQIEKIDALNLPEIEAKSSKSVISSPNIFKEAAKFQSIDILHNDDSEGPPSELNDTAMTRRFTY